MSDVWKIWLVHGPDHEDRGEAPNFESAEKWAEEKCLEHHDLSGGGLEGLRETFESGDPEIGSVQYGTNYHWVFFERVDSEAAVP